MRAIHSIACIADRLLDEPANTSLTSEPTGRIRFKPEYLSLKAADSAAATLGKSRIIPSAQESLPIYTDGENVCGTVFVKVPVKGSAFSHYGMRIELLGVVKFPGGLHEPVQFCALSSVLCQSGLIEPGLVMAYPFEFKHVEMPHESYMGRHVNIRYFLRVCLKRPLGDIRQERDFWVQLHSPVPVELDSGWQLEVGIEEQLHLFFSSSKTRFALNETIAGVLQFTLVNIRIKSADISLIRREIVGNRITDQEVLLKMQVLDGPAGRHDSMPFTIPLANLKDLTPTFVDVEKSVTLLYLLNLIIYDQSGHRYYKQQEIQLYRTQSAKDNPLLSVMLQ